MVRVQVRDEQGVDSRKRNAELLKSLSGPTSAIKYELFLAGFNENAGAEAVHSGLRRPCSQEGHFEALGGSSQSESSNRNQSYDSPSRGKHVEHAHEVILFRSE